MSDVLLILLFFFGVTVNNLILITRLERGRKREVLESNKRLDEVADRAAEAARLLASYHVQLAHSTSEVADRLKDANTIVAEKLKLSESTPKRVTIEEDPVPVTVVDEEEDPR